MELAARLRELGEPRRGTDPEYLAVDTAYHALLLEASGNPMLAALQDVVAEVLSGRTTLGLMPHGPDPGALEDHEATAAAVVSGDPAGAALRAQAVVSEVLHEMGGTSSDSPLTRRPDRRVPALNDQEHDQVLSMER